MTISSSEFHPMWQTQNGVVLAPLPFQEIADTQTPVHSSPESLNLVEFGDRPTQEVLVEERNGPLNPDDSQMAYERGFAEGREQGIAEGCERMLPVLETLGGLTEALEQTHADFRLDLERGLHALAIAVAKHLIQREVTADPTIVSDLVQRALDLVPHDVTLEVRLNPEDLEVLQGRLDQLEVAGRPLHLQWMGDPSLDRGSFLLETPLRVVDGRTDEALRALYVRLDHD